MPANEPEHDFERIYAETDVIAVIGAHPDEKKPAHYVPRYLQEQGFEVIPVNPGYTDREILGKTPVPTVAEIERNVDVVEIFRRGDKVSEHLEQILALEPLPKVVWMQKGIRNEEVGAALEAEGIEVVQDTCMMETHRELGLGGG